jgi:Arc/MetJ family transcription regulator
MRTTVELSEELIEDVIRLSSTRSKKEALRIALEDYVSRKRIETLLALPGTIDIEDVSEELEKLELEEERFTRLSAPEPPRTGNAKSIHRQARVAEQRKRYR